MINLTQDDVTAEVLLSRILLGTRYHPAVFRLGAGPLFALERRLTVPGGLAKEVPLAPLEPQLNGVTPGEIDYQLRDFASEIGPRKPAVGIVQDLVR
jgi:hypothetical protein